MADSRPVAEVEGVTGRISARGEAKADILPVTPSNSAKGLLSAIEPSNEVYIRYILCFCTIAAIFTHAQ